MSVVIDLNLVCLVCLRKPLKYHSIYDNDDQEPDKTIIEKISDCSELNVPVDSARIPDKICNVCYEDLRACWRFRKNCKEANTVFQYIHQGDDDSEVLATLELEQQQIKLPLGLKIKKTIPTGEKPRTNQSNASSVSTKTIPKSFKSANKIHKENADSSIETLATDDDSQDYDLVEDYRVTPTSSANIETGTEDYDELQQNTDDDANEEEEDVEETVERIYVDEAGEDDEEILGDTPTADERKNAGNKHKNDSNYKMNYSKIITTVPIKRGRGRPRKSNNQATSVLVEQNDSTKPANRKYYLNKTPAKRRRTDQGELRSPKICEICGNSYKYQHALNAHMRRHNNVRPYACEFCEKSFVACVELQRHMRVHTGQKPYACKFCDRRFSDFGSRLKHERTHTGERPYRCETCFKSFAYAHVLSVHVRTHTGEKRFQCQRCGRGFTKKAYLLSHQNQNNSRQACIPKMENVVVENNIIQVHEQNLYDAEYVVEELNENENELLDKSDRLNVKYEYDDAEADEDADDLEYTTVNEDIEQIITKPGSDEITEEQMAEEHLDDEDSEFLFEIR